MVPGTDMTRRGWLQVELFFYKKVELKDRDGKVIMQGTTPNDIELKLPQEIVITSKNILRNCPEGEPVWRIDKPKEFLLKERNLFVMILQNYPLSLEITINQEVLKLSCSKIQSCSFNKTSLDSSMMKIINKTDHFEVLIVDGKNDSVKFEVTSGTVYIAEPKEQEDKIFPPHEDVSKNNGAVKLLLTGLVFIAICFLVSFGFNAYYMYLQKEICCLCRSEQIEDNLYANSGVEVKQKLPIQTEGNARYVQPNLHDLPVEQYTPSRTTQNVNNSVQEDSGAYETLNTGSPTVCYSSCAEEGDYINPGSSAVGYSSCAEEGDYINPNQVKPHEVEIMIREKLIKGRVIPTEALQEVKPVQSGEYISLTQLQQNTTDTINEEPDYMNVPKRM
ncbi:uncharacterized protein [Palaemon carinicauda]